MSRQLSAGKKTARFLSALIFSLMLTAVLSAVSVRAAEILIFGFEQGMEGWIVPDWEKTSADYSLEECLVSQEHAGEGSRALELRVSFSGDRWVGAYVERQTEVTDWTPFGRLSADVYLPEEAPKGLTGKIILSVGDKWEWTEMNRSVDLAPGKWNTISVNLKPGSMDWKFFPDDRFRSSVRKIGVRVESNKGPVYRGSVFVDNVRLSEE